MVPIYLLDAMLKKYIFISLRTIDALYVFNLWFSELFTRRLSIYYKYFKSYTQKKRHRLFYKKYRARLYNHPFHMVTHSPWPLYVSGCLFALTTGTVLYFHGFLVGEFTLLCGLIGLYYSMRAWFYDIAGEGTYEGRHTRLVQRGLRMGMILFIVSEIMFFFSFFWGFFHSSLAPAIQIGGIWPPKGIEVFNPWDIPLLNTLILLSSGVTVTWAHYAVRSRIMRYFHTRGGRQMRLFFVKLLHPCTHTRRYRKSYYWQKRLKLFGIEKMANYVALNKKMFATTKQINFFLAYGSQFLNVYKSNQSMSIFLKNFLIENVKLKEYYLNLRSFFQRSRHDLILALYITVALGIIFTCIQYYEYKHAPFNISDSVYGSTFFLTTGFHGLHVIIGTIFLYVCMRRARRYHFTPTHHVGLESAIWYWHFVDVVWLGLYISIYHWGGNA